MRDGFKKFFSSLRDHVPQVWGGVLLIWLVMLCILPDPRPLGAPEWSVRRLRMVAGMSEPAARAAATVVLRGVGVGMIGVLWATSLQRLPLCWAGPVVVVTAPLMAVAAKWINFGYLPIRPQLQFIIAVAVLGALAGLSLRRSRIAIIALVALAVALVLWGTPARVPNDLEAAARAVGLYLLDGGVPSSQGDDVFGQLLEKAFVYAEDNSHGTGAVLPNRAAILALGVILGDDQVARVGRRELDPEPRRIRAAVRRRATIHGRNDLSQHFWVSAGLTVLSDEHRAWTVGLVKELKDATPGGSGFSFVDMAANKAGIRLAVVATRDALSARSVQLRIIGGARADDFVPDIRGLPEGISRDDFRTEYGGLGGAKTRDILAEIERRVNSIEGLQ